MTLFKKQKKRLDLNIAPLIDIVFLLLIFFMLTSEFTDFKTIDMISPNQSSAIEKNNQLPIIINLSDKAKSPDLIKSKAIILVIIFVIEAG